MIEIICGHYGCGKTNLAINMALDSAKNGEECTLYDLDLVNPYFRSGDYINLLEENGVRLVASEFVNSNLDIPALSPAIYSMLTTGGRRIVDLGGDDAGATAIGSFSARIKQQDYRMYYVVNRSRALSQTADEAIELLREIEAASRLKATHIINNTHLMQLTTKKSILESTEFAREISEKAALPLLFTVCERSLEQALKGEIERLYPVDIYVSKPWD